MKRFLLIVAGIGAVVLSLAAPGFAGRMPNPGVDRKLIGGFDTVNYFNEYFRGGETAVIRVEGDGSSDLDLYVYDQNGNLIVCDTDATDLCVVRFTPRWTGRFTVRVVNRGASANIYNLETN